MNLADKKAAAIFTLLLKGEAESARREKAIEDFHSLRKKSPTPEVGAVLADLFSTIATIPPERTAPDHAPLLKQLRILSDAGFVQTTGVLLREWRSSVAALPLEDVLPLLGDVPALELWRRFAKMSVRELENRLLLDLPRTYASAGADWLLLHGKPETLAPLLELFLDRQPRPRNVPQWGGAIAHASKKDKRGTLLDTVLRQKWADDGRIKSFGEVVRADRALLRSTVDLLPAILAKKGPFPAAALFVGAIFDSVATTTGAEREFVTACLARLLTGILLADRRSIEAGEILTIGGRVSRQLRNLTRDESTRQRTWVFENLAEPEESEGQVTLIGARHLAVALEKAEQGFEALDVLTAVLRNLGLAPIGKKGEGVSYSPLSHEDLSGGMLPGDAAVIEKPGWSHGGEVVVRAKTKKGA